jgi:hypothetical protein
MALAAFLLAGCSASISGKPIAPPPSLTAPCARPVALPEGDMTQRSVEVHWGRDRSALRSCADQLDGLAAWIAPKEKESRDGPQRNDKHTGKYLD